MKAITAWDLRTGRTLYRTQPGAWSEDLAHAETFPDAEGAAHALAAAQDEATIIVEPYLIDVAEPGAAGGQKRLRESIRAAGPTTRRDHGKQAGNP